MKGCIVYPFLYHADFSRGYSWTIELARKLSMPVFLFTVISHEYAATEKEACYYAFMKAHSTYIEPFVATHASTPEVRTEQICIESDTLAPRFEFSTRLIQLVRQKRDAIVVLQPNLFSESDQQQIIQASNSTIVLPGGIEQSRDEEFTINEEQTFYETFRLSHHFKMSDYFLKSLGSDKGSFNYLTSVFGRRC